jgi:hypothetical protein
MHSTNNESIHDAEEKMKLSASLVLYILLKSKNI